MHPSPEAACSTEPLFDSHRSSSTESQQQTSQRLTLDRLKGTQRWSACISKPWTSITLYLLAALGFIGVMQHVIRSVQDASNSSRYQPVKEIPHTILNNFSQEETPNCLCGSSITDAKAKGCKYDTLAAAWLPPHCIDEELTAEFDRSGSGPNGEWTYYNGSVASNYSTEITPDIIASMAGDPHFRFYTTGEWHVVHCLFYWRKLFRSRFTRVTVEARYDTIGHINHCIDILAKKGYSEMETSAAVALNT